ncbi:uncharacterized protein LOC113367758 [Ctenocephalides felis]|uniref:uncharacterized protein LOC113367758 n=1 Tax=Ctenocephalides felis TaxID=7515 RepID=UPI000E6E4212|nr:uncharacterized protein LOC113367758 [Ctenocephalides felis]
MKIPEFDFPSDTRVTPMRYLGYSPLIACCIEDLLPCRFNRSLRHAGHLRSFYIGMDVYQKAYQTSGVNEQGFPNKLVAFGDVLLWNGLANGFLPGAIIHEARYLISRYLRLRWAPGILCLAMIPMMISPIDTATQLFMNVTYRNLLGTTY